MVYKVLTFISVGNDLTMAFDILLAKSIVMVLFFLIRSFIIISTNKDRVD